MFYEEEMNDGMTITCHEANMIATEIISELTNRFPGSQASVSGLLSKKKAQEPCDEIEILFGMETEDEASMVSEVREFIEQRFEADVTEEDGAFKGTLSFIYETDENSIPVSISVTANYDWARGMGRSKKNTDFAGRLKIVLLKEMAAVAPYQGEDPDNYQNEYYESDDETLNGMPISQWKYSIDDLKGLNFVHRGNRFKKDGTPSTRGLGIDGKATPRWNAIDQTMPVTNKFMEMLRIIGGPKVRWTDFISTENILKFLFSDRYAYPEKLNDIKRGTMAVLEKSSAGLGENDVENFLSLWDEYQQKEQGASGMMNESRLNPFAMKINNLTARMNLL